MTQKEGKQGTPSRSAFDIVAIYTSLLPPLLFTWSTKINCLEITNIKFNFIYFYFSIKSLNIIIRSRSWWSNSFFWRTTTIVRLLACKFIKGTAFFILALKRISQKQIAFGEFPTCIYAFFIHYYSCNHSRGRNSFPDTPATCVYKKR